jgi:hypothetical protein
MVSPMKPVSNHLELDIENLAFVICQSLITNNQFSFCQFSMTGPAPGGYPRQRARPQFLATSTAKRRRQRASAEWFFDAKKVLPIGKPFANATR